MKIAIIGKLYAPIRTTTAMGQEKFTYNLARLLAKRGHQVTLFASGESIVDGVKVIPIIKKSFFTISEKNAKKKTIISPNSSYSYGLNEAKGYLKTLYYLRSHKQNFDIVHDNTDELEVIGLHKFLVDLPFVSTIHIPPAYLKNLDKMVRNETLNNYYIAISKKQSKMVKKARVFDVVYNGIDTKKFTYSERSLNHLSWIGRLDPNKGLGAAIEVATKTKSRLRIAGPIQNQKYFDEEIKPKLGKNIKYLGPLSGRKLVRFYKKSKAILFPIRWEEPFGLVMAEAMSCGTPIIAFRRGSVPELVIQGKTGFICPKDKTESMIKAVKKLKSMKKSQYIHMRENCRSHVEKNFTLEKMAENYEKVYQKIIDNGMDKVNIKHEVNK
jgi:glycosyltransferase involved in cell wall biosynthesis